MKKVNIDQYGGFDVEGFTKKVIECVDDALNKYDGQDGKVVTSVTLDRKILRLLCCPYLAFLVETDCSSHNKTIK